MFKTVKDLPEDVYKKYQELEQEYNYYSSLSPTVSDLKKQFDIQFKLTKLLNTYFPDSKIHTQKELYKMQIINTYFKKVEDSDDFFGDSKYHDEFVNLLDLLNEAIDYGKEISYF